MSNRHSLPAFALVVLSAVLPAAGLAGAADPPATPSEAWAVHGQTTLVWQAYPAFHADFTGINSLSPHTQGRETLDATLFVGVRVAEGLAFFADPEFDQGFGLSDTLGAAGFTSGAAYKLGHSSLYYRTPRVFFRYVKGLGGDSVTDGPGANVLAGSHLHDNFTLTVGKVSVPDFFDANAYAHDPRADFLNWAVIDSGVFDYAADSWGYTYGSVAEWTREAWSLRGGLFDLSTTPNSPQLQVGLQQYSVVLEAEHRHGWHQLPGFAKLLLFANRGRMGAYDAAVALAAATGTPPDTAHVRRYATRPGMAVNLQQELHSGLGFFLRAGVNDGSKEAFDFTDINRSLATGLMLQGGFWDRPSDTLGCALVVNASSVAARRYFAAGGLGLLVGDGVLPAYRPEKIGEAFYRLTLAPGASVSVDYQLILDPAYDATRGPVSVFGLRLHAEF